MFSTNIPFDTAIKVSFFDTDNKKVGGLTVEQANKVWQLDNSKLFYFQTGDGTEQELTIDQVNQLTPEENLLPQAPECPTEPQTCGPPLVKFFGGDGGFGAAANAVISPISSSVIGFDLVDVGKGFLSQPNAELIDNCGKGSGGSLTVNMEPDPSAIGGAGVAGGTGAAGVVTGGAAVGGATGGARSTGATTKVPLRIKNITINAPGDGYLPAPDGSLGGNERVWKEPDEGYVRRPDGQKYVVQPYRPIPAKKGDTYYPPNGPPRVLEQDEIITLPLVPVKPPDPTSFGTPYPVILCIEEIVVLDQGFGYRPGDQLIITPDNGTQTELVINEFGNITGVKILRGGCGYDDFPQIRTNSPTGFNATFTPIFKVTQIDPTVPIESQVGPVPDQVQLVTVIDCVGKFAPSRTFNVPR
jgi:hypothetical protein